MRAVVGQTLASVTDATTVIVIRAPGDDLEITCGGVPMVDPKTGPAAEFVAPDPAFVQGTQLGKRYEDDAATVEVLCTKSGTSSLAVNGHPLLVKRAKPLPASD